MNSGEDKSFESYLADLANRATELNRMIAQKDAQIVSTNTESIGSLLQIALLHREVISDLRQQLQDQARVIEAMDKRLEQLAEEVRKLRENT